MTDSKKLIGATLGTCILERQIGQGGMGVVYIARQLRPRRSVAVKVLLPASILDEKSRADFLTRFRREADAVAALDHIHIMPIYEYGEQDQLAYLVMPYIAGGTLRQILNERGSLSLSESLPIIEQVAEALDYAHGRGIIHRDIKPGNILFHADGRLLLADFGLAKMLSETTQIMTIVNPGQASEDTIQQAANPISSVSEGALIGTPEYLSPEQALGGPVDGRTDIYSLGIVLFHMLTGRVPFIGATPLVTAIMHTQAEPPSLSELVPSISPHVEAVIARAIAKQPFRRYATVGDFARALRAASEFHEPVRKSGLATRGQNSVPSSQILFRNDTIPEIFKINAQVQTVAQEQLPTPEITALPPIYHPRMPASLPGRKRFLLLAICLLALLFTIGGGVFTYLKLNGTTPHSALAHTTPTRPVTNHLSQFVPSPLIPVGALIYASALLDSACPGVQGSAWSKDANAQVTCGQNATELTNTASNGQQILAGMYLNGIGKQGIPDDYVLQVEAQPASDSQGEFGVFFRNQVANENGHTSAYAFLIAPDKTWNASYYDQTGARTRFATGSLTVPLTGPLTIDIEVQASTFTLYINGKKQGTAISSTYSTGTLGFAVSTDTDVSFKNLALYTWP